MNKTSDSITHIKQHEKKIENVTKNVVDVQSSENLEKTRNSEQETTKKTEVKEEICVEPSLEEIFLENDIKEEIAIEYESSAVDISHSSEDKKEKCDDNYLDENDSEDEPEQKELTPKSAADCNGKFSFY